MFATQTQPAIALVDADRDSYTLFSFSADDTPAITVGGEASEMAFPGLVIGTDVQAWDADLDYLATFTPTANVKTLLNAADFAAVRTALALTIGTNVQAWSANLDSFAGVAPAANTLTFLAAADYAAMVGLLSLEIGADVQAWDADLDTFALLTPTADAQTLLESTNFLSMTQDLSLEIGVDTQAYDAELAALAGLTSAANAIPYFTGSETADVISSSANMISLLGSADYATARTNLGLEIASDVQAYDAGIANLAALTMSADEFYYTSADNTHQTASVTSFGRSLLDDDSEATFKATVNLEADVDFNAYDADLTTYASITPTATAQLALQHGNNSVVLNHRHRVTVAEINTGHEILPAIVGKSYRMIECLAIAYGGAVGTTTTVDLIGTQSSGSVKLVAYAQAGLTQSSVLVSGGTNAAVTADGASYTACDVNTAITVGKTGGDADTATGVDFILTYVIE